MPVSGTIRADSIAHAQQRGSLITLNMTGLFVDAGILMMLAAVAAWRWLRDMEM